MDGRGDIGLVDKLNCELQRLKEETHMKIMPPPIDVGLLVHLNHSFIYLHQRSWRMIKSLSRMVNTKQYHTSQNIFQWKVNKDTFEW